MAENSYSGNSTRKKFYAVDGEGRLFRKATEQEIAEGGKNIVKHIKAKGANAGQLEMRRIVQSISGIVSDFYIRSSDYGDTLNIELYDDGTIYALQVPVESNFADDLFRKINNVKEGKKYSLSSWKMQQTDPNTKKPIPDKFSRGLSIKNEFDEKVERFINKEVQEKMLPLSKASLYDPTTERQSKDFWKIYFKVLLNEFKTRVLPTNQKRFRDWYDANVTEGQEDNDDWMEAEQNAAQLHAQHVPVSSFDNFPTMADAPPETDENDSLPF